MRPSRRYLGAGKQLFTRRARRKLAMSTTATGRRVLIAPVMRRKVIKRYYSTSPNRGRLEFSVPPDYPQRDPEQEYAVRQLPSGYKTIKQRVTFAGYTLFTREKIVRDRVAKVPDVTTVQALLGNLPRMDPDDLTDEEADFYRLARRTWLDLILDAPTGSVAAALRRIAERLYSLVGEVAGRGMGKTFSDNKAGFYASATRENIVAWAKYETKQIQVADYTSIFTKAGGRLLGEAGRAWVLWLCACADQGKTRVDAAVLSMNDYYNWDDLSSAERTCIRLVAKLDPQVAALVPPDPVGSAPTLEEL